MEVDGVQVNENVNVSKKRVVVSRNNLNQIEFKESTVEDDSSRPKFNSVNYNVNTNDNELMEGIEIIIDPTIIINDPLREVYYNEGFKVLPVTDDEKLVNIGKNVLMDKEYDIDIFEVSDVSNFNGITLDYKFDFNLGKVILSSDGSRNYVTQVGDFVLFTEDTPESNNPNNDFRNMILDFRQEFGVEEGVNEFDLRNFKFRYIAISPKRDLSMQDLISDRIRKDSEAVFEEKDGYLYFDIKKNIDKPLNSYSNINDLSDILRRNMENSGFGYILVVDDSGYFYYGSYYHFTRFCQSLNIQVFNQGKVYFVISLINDDEIGVDEDLDMYLSCIDNKHCVRIDKNIAHYRGPGGIEILPNKLIDFDSKNGDYKYTIKKYDLKESKFSEDILSSEIQDVQVVEPEDGCDAIRKMMICLPKYKFPRLQSMVFNEEEFERNEFEDPSNLLEEEYGEYFLNLASDNEVCNSCVAVLVREVKPYHLYQYFYVYMDNIGNDFIIRCDFKVDRFLIIDVPDNKKSEKIEVKQYVNDDKTISLFVDLEDIKKYGGSEEDSDEEPESGSTGNSNDIPMVVVRNERTFSQLFEGYL